jgi:DNA-binding LacI/PurR family transcriptional regulator
VAGKAPTMRDVAQLAGVSIQTVSYVVNGKDVISATTRARVIEAIEQLNYRRDPIARSMRTKQTRLIGLLVLDITNPVLSVIASAVEAATFDQGYKVILQNVGMDASREKEYLIESAGSLIDGLIIVNSVDRQATLEFLETEQVTAVLIDCLSSTTVPSVAVDNVKAAHIATSHTIALGHRRIAHITGTLSLLMGQQRQQGYLQALADHNLAYERIVVSKSERWDYQAGYDAMNELLRDHSPPTAVFAASDQMAIGAYQAIAKAGLRVPEDISVIGFDDMELAQFAVPALTTIRQPFTEIAANAISLLLQLIAAEKPERTQLILPPKLIIRQSTAELK